jgi:hypothetical protein
MYVAALVLFILAFSIIIATSRRRSRPSSPDPAPAVDDSSVAEAVSGQQETSGLEPETLAVIAAAARVAAGPGARIRKIRIQNGSTAWAEFGRMGIHSSHKIRKASR